MLRVKKDVDLYSLTKYGLEVRHRVEIKCGELIVTDKIETVTNGKVVIAGGSRSIRIIGRGSPFDKIDCIHLMSQDGLLEVVE